MSTTFDYWRSALIGLIVLAAIALASALLVFGVIWLIPGVDLSALSLGEIETVIRQSGRWGALVSIGLLILHSFLPFPAEIIAIANGMFFGPVWGLLLTWTGAMLGAVAGYGFARWLGRPCVRRVVGAHHLEILDRLGDSSSHFLFARLIPVISFNLINFAAGLVGLGWWDFLWTTAIGILPLTAAAVLIGNRLTDAPWWGWALVAIGLGLAWIAWRSVGARLSPMKGSR